MIFSAAKYLMNTAIKYPDKIACADPDMSYTYKELLYKAELVANYIIRKGVHNQPVGLYMHKSCDVVVAIWGILLSGNYYVAIDISFPSERILSIAKTLDLALMISDGVNDSEKICESLDVENYFCLIEEVENDDDLIRRAIESVCDVDPAYVMFTSGSTGTPKGVTVSHRALVDFIDNFTELFGIVTRDVIGNQAPFDFDVSVKDIFSSAKSGATLQIIPPKYFMFLTTLANYLDERKVTTLIWSVSAMTLMSSRGVLDIKAPQYINKVIFSGEVMPVGELDIWRKHYPEALFVNAYGPTEITCNCLYYIIGNHSDIRGQIPLGKPFPNKKVFLLDDHDELIRKNEINKTGEICVCGTGVALGYYGLTDSQNDVFCTNPLNNSYKETMYRTGDNAYYANDGQMYFAGRKDLQIKYMGHRIEMTEIDKAVCEIEHVGLVCTLFNKKKNQIITFVDGEAGTKEIIARLNNSLPRFMIPKIKKLKEMPLNSHGKIDRKKLMKLLEE